MLRSLTVASSVFALSTLVGCSNEKSDAKSGTGGEPTGGSAGSAGTGGGGPAAGSGGRSGAAGASGSGAGGASLRRGDVIPFVPGSGEVPYALGENPY
ncbi:MAG TPA: hypothetical protein VF103_07840, partial [Polyangiaceae bacterium]